MYLVALPRPVVAGFLVIGRAYVIVAVGLLLIRSSDVIVAVLDSRDGEGRRHIVRNGDVKQVINYSKEYAIAVVAVDVAYDADLPQVFAILRNRSIDALPGRHAPRSCPQKLGPAPQPIAPPESARPRSARGPT